MEDYADKLDSEGQDYLRRLRRAGQRMTVLIEHMLRLSRITTGDLRFAPVNLSTVATHILAKFREREPARRVETVIQPGMTVTGDPPLIQILLENLLNNAWKFTTKTQDARIEFTSAMQDDLTVYSIRDNGAGFDMQFADRLFCVFQRLHKPEDFPGDGIGLAGAQRVVSRHSGFIWAEGATNQGAVFHFTIGGIPKDAMLKLNGKLNPIV